MMAKPLSLAVQTRRRVATGILAVLGLLAVLGPALTSSDYRLDVARNGFYFAGLTATWSLLAGVAGQFSFAHVAIAGLAGYASAIWGRDAVALGPLAGNLWVSIVFGILFATCVGGLLSLLLVRLRGAYLALFTIAFSEIARLVIVAESQYTGGRLSLAIVQFPGTAATHYYFVLGAAALVLAVTYLLLRSRTGLFLRAMREDDEAAAALGLNATRLKVFVFTATSALVGFMAATYFHTVPRLVPENLDLGGMSLVIAFAVIGGLESPLAGGLAAISTSFLLESLRRFHIGGWEFEPGIWRLAIFGAVLVATTRFARNGLLMPVLDYFAGAAELRRQTVANRERPSAGAEESPAPAAGTAASGGGAPVPVQVAAPAPEQHGAPAHAIDLRVQNLHMSFGGLNVLEGVSFAIDRPQICGLIGPNGAGKTTLTNLLSGVYQSTGGTVFLRGESVTGLPPHEIARRGLGRTFQVSRAFKRMTVLENLLVPALAVAPERSRAQAEEKAMAALRFVRLDHLAHEYARALSGGQQKLLELARLLMLDADVLILDEPFAGVHPRLKATIHDFIVRLRDAGKAFIIIEHDMDTIFTISERLIVLASGTLIADGDPGVVKQDPGVIAAYLGEEESTPPAREEGAHA